MTPAAAAAGLRLALPPGRAEARGRRGAPEGVFVRALGPGDVAAVEAMGRRLSRQTLYRRFFAGVIRLPAGFVADLAERSADVVHLGAVAVRTGAVVGLATWARTEAGAEVALLVEDGYQGAGVGRLLACALAARCRAAGERLLVADVLSAHVRAAVCLARPHVCAVHVDYEGEVARLSAELAPLRPA